MTNNILTTPFFSDRALEILKAAKRFQTASHAYSSFGALSKDAIFKNDEGNICIDKSETTRWRHGKLALKLKLHEVGYACKNMVRDALPECKDKNSDQEFALSDCRSIYEKPNDTKFKVNELFCIYDICCGHRLSTIIKKYGEELVNALIGKKNDPFLIEQKRIYAEEKNALYQSCRAEEDEIRDKFRKKIEELSKERDELIKQTNTKWSEKIDELDMQFNEMMKNFNQAV